MKAEAYFTTACSLEESLTCFFFFFLPGENPPPFCEGVGFADLCVKAYNVSYEEHNFGGCLEIFSNVGVKPVVDLNMGCHYFGGKHGYPVAYGGESEYPIEKKIPMNHFYQMWNFVKERILKDVFKCVLKYRSPFTARFRPVL